MPRGDRGLAFFMTPNEAGDTLAELRQAGGLVIVSSGDDSGPMLLSHQAALPEGADCAYLGWPHLSEGDPPAVVANPGALGWVRFVLPRHQASTLLKSGLDVRTIWLTHNEPKGIQVFKQVSRPFRSQLMRPTWAWAAGGGEGAAYRDLGFTAGARALFEQGTRWMQQGVANIRFGPSPPPPS